MGATRCRPVQDTLRGVLARSTNLLAYVVLEGGRTFHRRNKIFLMNSPAEDEIQNRRGYEKYCCGGQAFQDHGSHD